MENIQDLYNADKIRIKTIYGVTLINHLHCNACALYVMEDMMKRVPTNISFDEELLILKNVGATQEKPIVQSTLNTLQSKFIQNRKTIVAQLNKDNPIMSKLYKTLDKQISMFEPMALLFLNTSIKDTLEGGHKPMKFISDLYQNYVIQYRLFQNDANNLIFNLED